MGVLSTAASIAQMTANDYQNAQAIYAMMQMQQSQQMYMPTYDYSSFFSNNLGGYQDAQIQYLDGTIR